jgi:nitrile hydratase
MGGRTEFFGPVIRERDEPTFHHRWEGRVFGISFFLTPLVGSIDVLRFAMEKLPRETYLSSYYRRWLGAFEGLLIERGYLADGEVDARIAGRPSRTGARRVSAPRRSATAKAVGSLLRPRLPGWLAGRALPLALGTSRPAVRRRRFAPGEPVRVRATRAAPYTRQPGYVSDKPGVVVAHLGATVFPDAKVIGERSAPQHLYTVAFRGEDLWGADADPGTEVRVDLYEPYLESR